MAEKRRVYLDSCCFIDMVKHEIGDQLEKDRLADVWYMKQLLQAARDGEVTTFVSTLAIAECTAAGTNVNAQVKSSFTRLLTSGQYIVLVQPTPFIMEDARDLRWTHGIILRGADAVHIASALDRKCEEFITTDGQLKKMNAAPKILTLGLRVIRGAVTQCLPPKYLQGKMDV
ncbi:MAG: type II toxin-antitoxin system VapC family toxin [Hyphomicrobiales bacterium]